MNAKLVYAAAAAAAAAIFYYARSGIKKSSSPPPTLPNVMKAVTVDGTVARGRCMLHDDMPLPVPKDTEVLIRLKATAINRLDISQRMGKLPVPPGVTDILGLEGAGVVVRIGSTVTSFAIGDEVLALVPGGGCAEYVAVDAATVMHKPPALSWDVAGSVPEAWLTAYKLVHVVGKVQAGEVVLIHAAASGVGVAAIQLVVALGATAIATVGSQDKLDLCVRLGAVGGAIRHDGPWLDKVAALAGKGGKVQVVLDPVASNYAVPNLEALAIDGRWVLYSLLSGPSLPDDLGKTFLGSLAKKRISLLATTLRTRPKAFKLALVQGFSKDVLPTLGVKGGFEHLIDTVYDGLEHTQEAHERMESNANSGKIVLRIP